MGDRSTLRDAATVIVLRDKAHVLMGKRGKMAAFMPNKFVFPGGAVDPEDAQVKLSPVNAICAERLQSESNVSHSVLAAAAIRELWEETGQILGVADVWDAPPRGWERFAQTGHRPDPSAFSFFFRAVTPLGNPRRFDARFFLVDASALASDLDDFSQAEDELSDLQWVALADVDQFDLPFITQVVLAELMAHIERGSAITSVSFFRNNDEAQLLTSLDGAGVLSLKR